MSEARTFKCPSCGSALSPQGDAPEIKCQYCGNTVIVPEELRAPKRGNTSTNLEASVQARGNLIPGHSIS